jgi:hypothetical protein
LLKWTDLLADNDEKAEVALRERAAGLPNIRPQEEF